MLETSLAFQGFVASSPLPIFEPKVGGHKISSQGRGFWRGVVIRTSDGSGTAEQMMVVVKVNGRYLMEDAEEETAQLWASERVRLGTTMAAAVPAGGSLSLLVQYDGAVPAGVTTGKAQANSWFRVEECSATVAKSTSVVRGRKLKCLLDRSLRALRAAERGRRHGDRRRRPLAAVRR